MYQEPVNRKIEIPTELTEYVFLLPLLNKSIMSITYYLVGNTSNSRFEAQIRNNTISRVKNCFFGSFTILLLNNFRHILCWAAYWFRNEKAPTGSFASRSITLHSVESQEFFLHSVFPWNECLQILRLKNMSLNWPF